MSQQVSMTRTVVYTLSAQDAEEINKRRNDWFDEVTRIRQVARETGEPPEFIGYQAHAGNPANEGDEFPAVVVRVNAGGTVNLRVTLDGTDDLWATSRAEAPLDLDKDGNETIGSPGRWHWPTRV